MDGACHIIMVLSVLVLSSRLIKTKKICLVMTEKTYCHIFEIAKIMSSA